MSILFEAWRRARGADARLSETLGAPPLPTRRRSAVLPWLLCFLFAAIAAGFGVYLWRRPERAPTGAGPVPAAAAAAPAVRRAVLVPRPQPSQQQRVAARGRTDAAPVQPATAPTLVAAHAPKPRPAASAPAGAAVAATPPPVSAAVPDAVRAALPPIEVTVHVWNPNPASRFIVIDGNILHAGDEIAPGVRLLAITRDGETVSFRGYRIELPAG